jgi:hypothetical protein
MKNKIIILLFTIFGLAFQSMAQGDLLITPRRVVFEGSKQKEELSLVNIGTDTAVYSISFVQRRMNEDGSFATIETPDSGQMFADPYLRIFPRQVVLAPREPQVIALQCRRVENMATGEYRSHLYFRAEKNNKPLGMEETAGDTSQLKVQLIPIFGISIPIIIRVGEVNASSTLSDLKLETQQDTIQSLKLAINRAGNISVYGDIFVDFVPTQGKAYEVGCAKGVGVYTNITKRFLTLKLNAVGGKPLRDGKLKVRYTSADEGKPAIYAEAELLIK